MAVGDVSYYTSLAICTTIIVSLAFILPWLQPMEDLRTPRHLDKDDLPAEKRNDDPFEPEPSLTAVKTESGFFESKVGPANDFSE